MPEQNWHVHARANFIQLLCDERQCGIYPQHMWYCRHSEFTRRNLPWLWSTRS